MGVKAKVWTSAHDDARDNSSSREASGASDLSLVLKVLTSRKLCIGYARLECPCPWLLDLLLYLEY